MQNITITITGTNDQPVIAAGTTATAAFSERPATLNSLLDDTAAGPIRFNDVDRGTPVGVVSSPQFYQSTSLAGNIFSSNSAVRRITLLATFSF